MKSLFALLLTVLTVQLINAQTWAWSSETPKAGEIVNVDIKGLDLKGDMHIVSYSFKGEELVTNDVFYLVDKDGIHVSLLVPSETNWVRLVAKDADNQPIAGDHKFVVKTGALAKSSQIEQAMATTMYARSIGLKRDDAGATALYREAIKADPEWLNNADVLSGYASSAKASKSDDDLKVIKGQLMAFDSKKSSESSDLLTSAVRVSKSIGDTALSMTLRKKLDKTYPKSLMKQEDQIAIISKAKTTDDKIAIRNKFKSSFGITDQNLEIYDRMTSMIIEDYATKQDWNKVEAYINEVIDPMAKANAENEYAWTLSGEDVDKDGINLEIGSRLSSASLVALTPELKKPSFLSKQEWEKNLEFMRAQFGDTYALILYKQGKYNEAIDHQAFAVKTTDYNSPDMNERFVIYLDKAGQKDELTSFVDEMIEMGKATEKMKEIHKKIWMTDKTPDQLYNKYVSKLEEKAKEKRLEEIKAMWMDAPAINFTLKNLNGEDVSLADYKGKTVILDFWATWCGPCKASFPGMKKVVEHYAQDKDVVFLFVDTWENGEKIPERVSAFINDNKYPFPVVLDSKTEVVTNYKVDGIPTKFIIDKDQKIRFKAVGYSGSTDALVEELTTMIEMAQNGGTLQKS
ncbi:MAG: TlpA disulfide reductase family protein [Saprospiraceae bacterium]